MKIYMVGGAVRDKIMNRQPHDIDYAVEAGSYAEMRQYLLDIGCDIKTETPEFVTIRAKHPKYGFSDFVLCRKDGTYRDGRHPEYVRPGDIYDDLLRRDFTMNAMAWDLEEDKLFDPFGGEADINRRLVKCVISPESSFYADQLRVIRAVRQSIQLEFSLEGGITRFLSIGNFDFDGVSEDRLRGELHKMFAANTYYAMEMFRRYPRLITLCFDHHPDLWLMPTLKAKKK